MFQRSIFEKNTILLEVFQSKQKPNTIEFLLAPYQNYIKNE